MFSCIAVWGALLLVVLMLYWAVWSPALLDMLVDHGLPLSVQCWVQWSYGATHKVPS